MCFMGSYKPKTLMSAVLWVPISVTKHDLAFSDANTAA